MFSMKGVLNLQLRDAFIAALQRLYKDERFIERSCRDLASREEQSGRQDLLMRLAWQANRKALVCGVLLSRIGCPVGLIGHKSQPKWAGMQPSGHTALIKMERLERADFHRLYGICSVQSRWV